MIVLIKTKKHKNCLKETCSYYVKRVCPGDVYVCIQRNT